MSQSLSEQFLRLVQIMDDLREKCPWDKKQTIQTLRPLTLEETYELTDAITDENWQGIKEELGDVLLHILFYAKIGGEQQQFTLQQVIEGVCEKLIVRHPHIYGDVQVNNEEDVKRNWEQIKLQKEGKKSVFSGVPVSLPAVVKGARIQEKAAQVGFEWDNKEDVWKKVEEEMQELQEAVQSNNQAHVEEEFGDVLFSLINYARFLRIDAEGALEKTNKKFISRFMQMEEIATAKGKSLSEMSLPEMDAIWDEVKQKNKQLDTNA
ncbi:XTP/dITP diphosphohydrolase [Filimonas lacunae]|uniref:Nucleoside triphosphate pyrophosphohydrolase n=1 Tax=Filimonas lacunae TaxID=477680 RepID=A0A173MAX0_9BACT|nr:nucleoside triphosphate pyrophosphohydrolase [Filimonas lacunae]BAV04704.1 nucleoside triphosphate pyrophosphohydrolase MazG [Filimonas lacunae]SIT32336.1 XTP/dITP diphosphohydrolase [Filimonas lacunae]